MIKKTTIASILVFMLIASMTPANASATNFNLIYKNVKLIPQNAWSKTNYLLKNLEVNFQNTQYYVGPTTKVTQIIQNDAINKIKKVLKNFIKSENLLIVYSNYNDKNWAKSVIDKIAPNSGIDFSSLCRDINSCSSAVTTMNPETNNVVILVFMPENFSDKYLSSGDVEMHEYAHTVQISQFINTSQAAQASVGISSFLPCWFTEGQANFYGLSSGAKTIKDYLSDRKRWSGGIPMAGLPNSHANTIQNYLKNNTAGHCDQSTYQESYSTGFLVVEAMVAAKDPDSTMELVKNISIGLTWDQSFEKVYGISCDKALPILAKIASLER